MGVCVPKRPVRFGGIHQNLPHLIGGGGIDFFDDVQAVDNHLTGSSTVHTVLKFAFVTVRNQALRFIKRSPFGNEFFNAVPVAANDVSEPPGIVLPCALKMTLLRQLDRTRFVTPYAP